ncbi:hypothetical protein Ancab_020408 [Ancistrocladus abbreviatus]
MQDTAPRKSTGISGLLRDARRRIDTLGSSSKAGTLESFVPGKVLSVGSIATPNMNENERLLLPAFPEELRLNECKDDAR